MPNDIANNMVETIRQLENEIAEIRAVIKAIYIETTTDHYGDALVALKNIDEILIKSQHLWS